MCNNKKDFLEKGLIIKEKYFKYYLSPILFKNNFNHGFFTKTSSEIKISHLSKHLNKNNSNCVLKQIHSSKIVFGSNTQIDERVEADGLVNDKHAQNLWIYTADCMPILFADKKRRYVAAIHCGRKGLENKIIKNLIKIFSYKGCSKDDLLVAIGPSISEKNYRIDNKTFQSFYKQITHKESISSSEYIKVLSKFKPDNSILLNLKKNAHIQLLDENIPNSNIDISNLCTYESSQDFYSWRRSKTSSRQWNFISS